MIDKSYTFFSSSRLDCDRLHEEEVEPLYEPLVIVQGYNNMGRMVKQQNNTFFVKINVI